jgi:hypothetical protein
MVRLNNTGREERLRCKVCGNRVGLSDNYCQYCGAPLRISSSSPSSRPEYRPKGKRTGIFRIVVIASLAIVVIIIAGFLVSEQGAHLVTRPAAELLPVREDLSTEWIVGNVTTESLSITGFTEGVKLTLTKSTGLESEGVIIRIYKFTSSDSASEYYNSVLSDLKAKGGYEEVSTGLGTGSYGTFIESMMGERTDIYAVKTNVFVEVRVVGYLSFTTQEDATQLARIILDKIRK